MLVVPMLAGGVVVAAPLERSDPKFVLVQDCGVSLTTLMLADTTRQYRVDNNLHEPALSSADQSKVGAMGGQHPLNAYLQTVIADIGNVALNEGFQSNATAINAQITAARQSANGDGLVATKSLLPALVEKAQQSCQLAGYQFADIKSVSTDRPVDSPTAKFKAAIRTATPQEKAAMTKAVERSLLDPESARYRDSYVIPGSQACLEVNSKNRMGGYVGFKYAVLTTVRGEWVFLNTLDGPASLCQDMIMKFAAEEKPK
jgi:hypothetical protein